MDLKDVSDVDDIILLLRRLRQAAERAEFRKGIIPTTTRLGRGQAMSFITQVPPPYPPCVRSAASLQAIPISKVKLEEHHRGKQVVIRTTALPDRINAVMAIVEDKEGTAVLLQLYNQPEQVKADDLLRRTAFS
ncbi:hypothetical protein LY76DRAFT_649828 [Colletotrichum caudatum]|nr:hypothetical protein LY76DRAFT_649828 [Colletotrichum caudatum]